MTRLIKLLPHMFLDDENCTHETSKSCDFFYFFLLTDNHSFADYYSINLLCLINNTLEDNISKTVFEVTGLL